MSRARLAMAALLVLLAAGGAWVLRSPEEAPKPRKAAAPPPKFPLAELKQIWRKRLADTARSCRCLPVIDVESTFDQIGPYYLADLTQRLDRLGVALTGFSFQNNMDPEAANQSDWRLAMRTLIHEHATHFFPVTAAGLFNRRKGGHDVFLREVLTEAEEAGYPMLGEFFFRHYPSDTDHARFRRGDLPKGLDSVDHKEPIDGPLGELLFSFSERTGLPFQIHYEVEDRLLPPLEAMLKKHPGAKVIWCHVGRVREPSRSNIYELAYVRRLLERYPNLYFDISAVGPGNHYVGNGQLDNQVFDHATRKLRKEWAQLIIDRPWRFLAAIDLGPDRVEKLEVKVGGLRRNFLNALPRKTAEIVAYKGAWKLLFGEDLDLMKP